jgi:hypothetical protein
MEPRASPSAIESQCRSQAKIALFSQRRPGDQIDDHEDHNSDEHYANE